MPYILFFIHNLWAAITLQLETNLSTFKPITLLTAMLLADERPKKFGK